MLLRKFHLCSEHVENKLFMTYCNNVFMFTVGEIPKAMYAPMYCFI